MHFALPNSLLPDNKDLDFWLHQETKTAQVCESPVVEKKQLPTDNLSTWLSTRYAANLTKKSSEPAPVATAASDLNMWLAEKRRKLSENDGEDISMWLHPACAKSDDQDGKRKRCVVEDLATMTLEETATAARLCPALSNWQAQADLPLDVWLKDVGTAATATNEDVTPQGESAFEWLRGPVAEVRSEFVFADLPVESWLSPPPPTPLDEGVERLALDPVGSWLDESEFEMKDNELTQWLLVGQDQVAGLEPDQESLDDGSSIIVLDSAAAVLDLDDSKSSASSWKFW